MTMDVTKTRAGENYLTEPEEKQLFSYLKQLKIPQAERDYVLINFARVTGLRRIEICRLNISDVYGFERPKKIIASKKRINHRKKTIVKTLLFVDKRIAAKGSVGELHIPEELQALMLWFYIWKKNNGEDLNDNSPLFVSRNGSRLNPSSINRSFNKWLNAAGINHHVTFHGLRHTKAQRIMHDDRYLTPTQQKNALLLANKQLRHKSLNSTMIYVAPSREDMATVAGI